MRAQEILYKAMVQTVLIYGSEIWLVTGEVLKVLRVFHHQVDRLIAVKMDLSTVYREWEWSPVAYAMDISGI